MSVIQCASVATKAAVRDLESGKCFGWSRLHALRQGQMMETLECLLQMGSYLHTMVTPFPPDVATQRSSHACNSDLLEPPSRFPTAVARRQLLSVWISDLRHDSTEHEQTATWHILQTHISVD